MAIEPKAIKINGKIYSSMRNELGTEHGSIVGTYSPNTSNEDSHGTYYLADNPQLFEPQRQNNFVFWVDDLNGIRRAGLIDNDEGAYATFPGAEQVIRVSVSSAFLPTFTQQPIEIKRGNGTLKYAGAPSFNEGSVELNDYIGAEAKDILLAWQNLSYNTRTQKVGLASEYKKTAHITEYSPDMQEVRTWNIYGCWISALNFGTYSADSADKQKITATIQYDWGEIDTHSYRDAIAR